MSIVIQHVRHTFASPGLPPTPVLHAIPELSLRPGEQILLRGISGSGKTTLFNILAGLLRPTAGEVIIDGQPLYVLSEAQRDKFRAQRIGYVFQQHHLLPMLTAEENVMMPLAFGGIALAERRGRATELLTAVGLSAHAHHRPAQLSTGQRLRVAVARALAARPRLVLADEPTAALDAATSEQVLELLTTTCRAQQAILVVASHDPALHHRFGCIWNLTQGTLHDETPTPP